MGYTRREMEKMATDRKRWRSLVDAPSEQKGISTLQECFSRSQICPIFQQNLLTFIIDFRHRVYHEEFSCNTKDKRNFS